MRLTTATFLAALASTAAAIPAFQIQASETCAAQGLEGCPAGLPSTFCCAKGYSCHALAGNSTALCCPSGQDCAAILAITCDITQQDVSLHGDAPIKTVALDATLTKCGPDACCPFGYSCANKDGDASCILNKDQSTAPDSKLMPTKFSSAPPTSSPTSPATSSTDNPAAATSAPPIQGGIANPELVSIIGGAAGGVFLLIVITTLACCCIRRRRRRRQQAGPRNDISYPIPQPAASIHTDFYETKELPGSSSNSVAGLRSPGMQSSISQQPINRHYASPVPELDDHRSQFRDPEDDPRNPFGQRYSYADTRRGSGSNQSADELRTGQVGAARVAPIRQMKASSIISRKAVPSAIHREPSTESIEIGVSAETLTVPNSLRVPGSGTLNRSEFYSSERNTTMSGMMEEAGLRDVAHGKAYVPQ
ncbi:hypothetical protein VHEMI02615 [[Torrubiella] hemipterigena]|uniref:Mid2 domain-containing protein n=1 Tax=[Torrubiella] hemipterigena TaxID=1531966 RepID=A0A0A1SWA7_9HYPO|nr:hypothetical protein VHEMI02615 [[Torrubiella] hemipterigena]